MLKRKNEETCGGPCGDSPKRTSQQRIFQIIGIPTSLSDSEQTRLAGHVKATVAQVSGLEMNIPWSKHREAGRTREAVQRLSRCILPFMWGFADWNKEFQPDSDGGMSGRLPSSSHSSSNRPLQKNAWRPPSLEGFLKPPGGPVSST